MDKKLTLSLDASVIEQAKIYAGQQGTSLSRMIENYLASLVQRAPASQEAPTITPLVERLSGVLTLPLDSTADSERDAYTDYLSEKYR